MASLTQSITDFSTSLETNFFSGMREIASIAWTGWYGLALIPVITYFAFFGLRYMTGTIDGEKLKKEAYKFGKRIFFLLLGCTLLPTIETFASYLNGEIINTTTNLPTKMYTLSQKKVENATKKLRSAMADLASGTSNDPELKAFLDKRAKESGTIGIISFDNECIEAAKNQSKTLLPAEVDRIQEIISSSGAFDVGIQDNLKKTLTGFETEKKITDNLKNFAEADPENFAVGDMSGDKPFWRKTFSEILAELFTFIGALLALLMKFLRTGILFLFRLALPIVICVSFAPSKEGALKEWWNSYSTLALMLVTFSLIEALSRMGWLAVRAYAHVDGVATVNAIMAFIVGILYLIAPSLTVMMFGGSQAMGSISGQIMAAGALMGGLAKGPAKWIKDRMPAGGFNANNSGDAGGGGAAGGGGGGGGTNVV